MEDTNITQKLTKKHDYTLHLFNSNHYSISAYQLEAARLLYNMVYNSAYVYAFLFDMRVIPKNKKMISLRDYQLDIADKACELLKEYKIAYLAMQVRTGKTLTAFQTAKNYGANTVLFVTKKKAIDGIIDDFSKFTSDIEIKVINYEQLHNVKDQYDIIIVDEAHSLGQFPNPSERTERLKKICYNKPIIYLSGTPTPESYSQLYHQFWISSYSPFQEPTFYKWAKEYVVLKKKYIYNREINDYSGGIQELIEGKTQHLFLHYTQEEAGFKELVKEYVHYVKMEDTTYRLVKRLRNDKLFKLQDTELLLADTAAKLLNKMHQIYSGTVIFDESMYGSDGQILDHSKVDFIFNNFIDKKLAIFYKFRAESHLLRFKAITAGYKVYENVEEFNNCTDKCIFISQFQSGREGINLSTADRLICYNIDFSAVTYWQCRARIQSKDRANEASLHWIFSEGGIEKQIYQAVMNKKNYTLSYFKKEYKLQNQ